MVEAAVCSAADGAAQRRSRRRRRRRAQSIVCVDFRHFWHRDTTLPSIKTGKSDFLGSHLAASSEREHQAGISDLRNAGTWIPPGLQTNTAASLAHVE